MDQANDPRVIRTLGGAFITFAVAFNVPYAWLASVFNYPAVLRRPPGEILEAFAAAGTSLILIWAMFALAALGVAAALAQAIGLSRWVYAVPGLAARWTASPAGSETRAMIEAMFATLHQFAGVGIGEAIGQTLTALWLIAVAIGQLRHPRFGRAIGTVGLIGGIVLLLGLVEGLATVIRFDPGIFSFAALVGFLVLTLWLIWTGVLCIARPAAVG
jgi:hypothetical protein